MRLISADIATVLASRQLPHIYQQLYHTFSQRQRRQFNSDGRGGRVGRFEVRGGRVRGGQGGWGGLGKGNINQS